MDSLIKFIAQYLIVAVIAGVVVAWYKTPKESRWRFMLSVAVAGVIASEESAIAAAVAAAMAR